MDEDPRFPLYVRWTDVGSLLASLPVPEQIPRARMIYPDEALDDHVLDVILTQGGEALVAASEDMWDGSPMDDQEAPLAVAAAMALVDREAPVPDRLDGHLGKALSCHRPRLMDAAQSVVASLPEPRRVRVLARACDACWSDVADLQQRFEPREIGRGILALLDREPSNPGTSVMDRLSTDLAALPADAFVDVAAEALRGKTSAKRARLVLLAASDQPPSEELEALLAPLERHSSKAVRRLAAGRPRAGRAPVADTERAQAFARLTSATDGADPEDLPPVLRAFAHARRPDYSPQMWGFGIDDALRERPRPTDLLYAAVAGLWLWHDDRPRDLSDFVRRLVKVPGMKAAVPTLLEEDLVAWKQSVLHEVLAKLGGGSEALWLRCLDHPAKRSRELAMSELRASDDDLSAEIVQVARSGTLPGRTAAIQLLADHPPTPEVLEELLASERSAKLRTQLDRLRSATVDVGADLEAMLLARLEGIKARKRPTWVGRLPPLSLASGARLDKRQIDALITLLREEGPDAHDEGLMALRDAFGTDAAAWSRALFEQWSPYLHLPGRPPPKQPRGVQYSPSATGPSGHKWAVFQQAFFADDDQVDTFGRFLVASGNDNWRFGTWCVAWLERHGTEVADDALAREVLFGPYGKAREAALAAVGRRAEALGRTVGEQLAASVHAQVGRGELPKASADGTPEEHTDALVVALERWMGEGAWLPVDQLLAVPTDVLETVVFLHDGMGVRLQDGEWLGAHGEGVDVPADARLTVAHPVELGPEATKAFATQLVDYQHIAAFPQLARSTPAPSALTRRDGVFQPALHRHLKSRGYQVHGRRWEARRSLPPRGALLVLTWEMDDKGRLFAEGGVRDLTGEGASDDAVARSELAYELAQLP